MVDVRWVAGASFRRLLLAFVLPVGLGVGCGDAPEPQPVSIMAIRFSQVALLGGPDDPASFRDDRLSACVVGRLGRGDYLVGASVGGGDLMVYPPQGGAVTRVLGRPGQGPGEFGSSRPLETIVTSADSIYVNDPGNSRITVLSPEENVVRSIQLQYRASRFALLADGTLLLHPTAALPVWHRFERLEPSGTTIWQRGSTVNELDQWGVSPSASGGFWAYPMIRYQLYHLSAEGDTLQAIDRSPAWFPDGPMDIDEFYANPIRPILQHVWEDDQRRLWVYAHVPDSTAHVEEGLSMTERERRRWNTRVEVIDAETGEVLASGAHDYRLHGVCNSSLVYTVVETPEGDTRVSIVQPVLPTLDQE